MNDDQIGCLGWSLGIVVGLFVAVGLIGLLIIGWREVIHLFPSDG